MKLAEYADILVRLATAFESKIGGKYSDLLAVEAMIPGLRQDAILITYNGSRERAANKNIHPALIQKFTIDINQADQWDVDYLVFQSPRFASISTNVFGDVYVGAKKRTKGFKRIGSRSELDIYKTRGYLNDGRVIMYQPIDEEIHVYGNDMLKQIYVEGVVMDPLDVSDFDPETDQYPMDDATWQVVIDLFKQKIGITINKVQDTVNNDVDTMSKGPIKGNNV